MKVPDKIYIAETPNKLIEIWGEEPIESNPYITEHEYIRKDTLLKLVKERKGQMKIEAAGCSNMLAAGEWLAYDKLIEKIESM